jgi:hypothetical protein
MARRVHPPDDGGISPMTDSVRFSADPRSQSTMSRECALPAIHGRARRFGARVIDVLC